MTRRIAMPVAAFAMALIMGVFLAVGTYSPALGATSDLGLQATSAYTDFGNLAIKRISTIKYTDSLVTYPGLKKKLTATVDGAASTKVRWSSSNKKVATVNKLGLVKSKKRGRCYIKAKYQGVTVKVLVEVTSKKAYKAVMNAYKDKRTKISYSQSNRMDYSYRDCSSFVSRCYWDSSLGREIFVIGDEWNKEWANPAAEQAYWLNTHGKRISYKACKVKKLRPGDTIYYQTNYAGTNDRYRHIDHTDIYIGNGYVMGTHGWGGKGEIGLKNYWPNDSTIRFIGRPCP